MRKFQEQEPKLMPLRPKEVVAATEVARSFWLHPQHPFPMRACHRVIFTDTDTRAGKFRATRLVGISGTFRDYQSPERVEQLLDRVFYPAYEQVLTGAFQAVASEPADVAWGIGALFRCIHPFETGNILLSWLIESQVRLRFGERVIVNIRSRQDFVDFREQYFLKLVEVHFG
ncbi:MAG: hypothetical protein ACK4SL_02395 [Candidatus Paceibacteria bacterium]